MAPSSVGGVVGPDTPGGSNGATTTGPGNPSQPHGTSTTTMPGQPSNPVAPSNTGNQPSGQPSAGAKPAAYARRLASGAAQSSSAATSVTLHTSGASSNGDTLLVSVMLTNTKSGGVGASDSAGNSYSVVADQTDGAGDRTLILAAVGAKALSGGSLTVTFPATQEHHVALDDFTGVTGISGHSSATATSGSFASGSAPASGGIAFGVAGVQGGENATWSGGFTTLPTVFASADQLATAYETIGSGSVQASGSCNHQWMAAVVTLAG